MSLTSDIDFGGRLRGSFPLGRRGPIAGNQAGIPDYRSAADAGHGWRERAACRGEDTELFFADRGSPGIVGSAKVFCRRCVVVDRCLAWALETGQRHGVWGGFDHVERASLTEKGARRGARARALQAAVLSAAAAEAQASLAARLAAAQRVAAGLSPQVPALVPGLLSPNFDPQLRPLSAVDIPMPETPTLTRHGLRVDLPSCHRRPGEHTDPRRPLTERERQILELLDLGSSYEQVGHMLHISTSNVSSHKTNITKALGATADAAHCVARGYARGELKPDPDPARELPELKPRHLKTLRYLGLGYSNPRMATALHTTVDSVKYHVKFLFEAFGVESRVGVVGFAFRNGVLEAVPDRDEARR